MVSKNLPVVDTYCARSLSHLSSGTDVLSHLFERRLGTMNFSSDDWSEGAISFMKCEWNAIPGTGENNK